MVGPFSSRYWKTPTRKWIPPMGGAVYQMGATWLPEPELFQAKVCRTMQNMSKWKPKVRMSLRVISTAQYMDKWKDCRPHGIYIFAIS